MRPNFPLPQTPQQQSPTTPTNHTTATNSPADKSPDPLQNKHLPTPDHPATRTYVRILIALTLLMVFLSVPKELANPQLGHINTIPQRAKVLGYERYKFGTGWATAPGAQCDTRSQVIASALIEDSACLAPAHEHQSAQDPYSSDTIAVNKDLGNAIEIDHIIPLSAAWDLGAHSWDYDTRVAFANDPINLVAVSRAQNQAKSDQLPSEWMPEKRSARCWYANRMAEVATKYDLPLPKGDLKVLKRQCLPRL